LPDAITNLEHTRPRTFYNFGLLITSCHMIAIFQTEFLSDARRKLYRFVNLIAALFNAS